MGSRETPRRRIATLRMHRAYRLVGNLSAEAPLREWILQPDDACLTLYNETWELFINLHVQ